MSKTYLEDDVNTKFCKSKGLGSIETGTTHIEEFSYKDRSFLKMMDKSSRKTEVHHEITLSPKVTEGTFPNIIFD